MNNDFDPDFDDPVCNGCGSLRLLPMGKPSYPGLVVFDFPTQDEIARKRFHGSNFEMFMKECTIAGVYPTDFRITSLYNHAPNNKKRYKEECEEHSVELLLEQIIISKVILAVGATVSKYLSGNTKIQTCIITPCAWNTNVPIVTAPHLGLVFTRSFGELRLSLKKFKNLLQQQQEQLI